MRYLLDTNACIEYLRGRNSPVQTKLEAIDPSLVVLCSVVKAELNHGARKSARPEQSLRSLEKFYTLFASLPFDDRAAEAYGRLRARLEQQGASIGPYDLMIAAIALANDATLVTHNAREFGRIAELKTEDWELQ